MLFIVVVTVAAGPFKLGVNPGTTPGVVVKLGGGAAGAGAADVELQPSDIGGAEDAGGAELDVVGGAASCAGIVMSLSLSFGGVDDVEEADELLVLGGAAGAGEPLIRLPPGAGGGARAVLMSLGGGLGAGLPLITFPPGAGGGAVAVLISLGASEDDELVWLSGIELGSIGPGPMFEGIDIAGPMGSSKVEPVELPDEGDPNDPLIEKFAQAMAVPLDVATTRLRLPTKAADPSLVDRY